MLIDQRNETHQIVARTRMAGMISANQTAREVGAMAEKQKLSYKKGQSDERSRQGHSESPSMEWALSCHHYEHCSISKYSELRLRQKSGFYSVRKTACKPYAH